MTLMSRGGAELRYWAACALPTLAFTTAATNGSAQAIAALSAFVLAILVAVLSQTSGSGAAWVTADSQALVAHFTFRSSESIPLARIAALEVEKRISFARPGVLEPISYIRVFRKDVPGVVEIRARTWEADGFLFALARNAKRLGLTGVAPFTVPRRHYVHDLLPLVPALAIVMIFPFRVVWPALALAVSVFVAHSAIGWRRFATLSRQIARGEEPARVQTWVSLLRRA
ncbi:MAG: hypothetical protein KF850_04265 [Labilithrix sp.]|nr:hypothetical protein [Labilithrix sp.]MBX3211224.1 hypothetical protein [Labilithrix sp.]